MWIQGVKQMRSGILTDSSHHSLSLYGKEAMYGNGDSGCHSAYTLFALHRINIGLRQHEGE